MNIYGFPVWDKTKAYSKYEFVRVGNNAYYSTTNVPADKDISDRSYWLLVVSEGVPVNSEQLQSDQIERAIEGGSGGGVRLLPSTGQSTVDGMTQKAITDAINSGGTGIVLQPTTGQSTKDGMTQKAITDALLSKADGGALESLSNTVASLTTTVNGKANQSSLDALSTTVDGKANQSYVEQLEGGIDALEGIVADKQDKLISGTNIKTINGQDIIGSGNIDVGGGSSIVLEPTTGQSTTNGMTQKAITDALSSKATNEELGQLTETVNTKANAAELNALTNTVDGKADKSSITALETQISGKADKSSLTALETTVQGKANQSSLDELSVTVSGKADQSALDALSVAVSSKADISSVEALETALQGKQNQLIAGDNITLEPQANNTTIISASGSSSGGVAMEVGVEKPFGTYTEDGVTYQTYSKIIKIDALPSTAGITQYPHGITGIKQILQAYGFTNDGFVLNAPRQNAQDDIAIFQVQKAGNISIEVGKDRSSKSAYVCLIYAKNNN